ncbi:MAG: ABC transporter permease [Bacteroidaceae bacterium]|nr:ABC transporter permease [Bacteroidaceae bacterium]
MNQQQNCVSPSPLHRGRGWGWVHFSHNLKIAFRNLLKYKFQTLVSVLALAVGMVTLAATHFVLIHFGNPAICDEPYFDRTYEMSFVKLHHEDIAPNPEDRSVAFNTQTIRILEDIHTALTSGGGMVGVEKLFYVDDQHGESQIIIEFPDSTEREMDMRHSFTMPEYLNFRGARSALTGEKIPVLNNDEAVLSETLAKFIFGDKNPVGNKIRYEYFSFEENRGVVDTYTVTDVVKTMSTNDVIGNWAFFCMRGSEHKAVERFYATKYEVLLLEGYTAKDLEQAANLRLQPLGLKAKVESMSDVISRRNGSVLLVRTIVYLISSMVLLTALVGFLKMQLQLFQMRRREVMLRIVHGASKWSLYGLFLTEVSLVLALALAVALVLMSWLVNFVEEHFRTMFDDLGWVVYGYNATILQVFCVVALLSAFIVWVALRRIRKSNTNLAAGLHRNAGHSLRNTMLGIQLVVSLVFLSGALAFTQFIGLVKDQKNIPENDDHYLECLAINPYNANDFVALKEYLQIPRKGIKRAIEHSRMHMSYKETEETPGAKEALGTDRFETYFLTDTAFFDFWQRPIKWFVPEDQRKECIVLNEALYTAFDSLGVIKNGTLSLHLGWNDVYEVWPVGGTFATLPYMHLNQHFSSHNLAIFRQNPYGVFGQFIIEPEEGKYLEVMQQLKDEMRRINPLPLRETVLNLRDTLTEELQALLNLQRGAWILSAICALICFMGIWSTIALDTRSRQKEVALRKVHGAKRKDIALLFGRLYLWLIGIATLVSAPLIILFNTLLKDWANSSMASSIAEQLSPILPILASLALTALIIILIVGHHIQQVLQVKPAEMIAKE